MLCLHPTHQPILLLRPVCSTNIWTNYDTAVDVAIRDASYKPDPNSKGVWPSDKQGYSLISHADTAENYAKYQKQWVKHETTFTAPSDTVSLLNPGALDNSFSSLDRQG